MVSPAIIPSTQRRTRHPSRASFSAMPSPIQSARQSAITTLAPTFASPFSTCQASTTCAMSVPGSTGRRGFPPVATTTTSGASASMRARVTVVRRAQTHASEFHLAREVRDDPAELGAARQQLGEQCLAALARRRLPERHLVAAFGKNRGRLESGRAGTSDEHFPPPGGGRLPRGEAQLAAGFRELDAGDGRTLVERADAGLVAADAGSDVIRPPCALL